MKNYFFSIILLVILAGFSTTAQTRIVQGQVTTLDNLPVANFEVHAKKSGAGINTDSLGRFSIVTKEKDVLLFKGKVFRNERVRINEKVKDSLFVQVTFIPTPENKKMAIGYGYVSEEDLINSVSHMNSKDDDFCNYNDIFELIRGRFAGVEIRGRGAGAEVVIRGTNSINLSSCALYVLDGVTVRSISHISPCQVASIDIVKDAGSSIYGSRGANGVVLIETKKGPE
ncbi:TonB-dependent receptor plug domain-containing protein [Marinilabilia salmonicolor]|uniref:TonB-dependent SusC/RagA subfamily outer membrane receptor n=1 Tax=Marinilabilia salmonicolor TaxID=989 RepID=A0A368UQU1_9BACT|nr:TonB-dependent receptor plug domain-containing protein [Marinilabilia salmonicolor]RCW29191.1 TonB-dependent SusC/RagA subfamily outer membrane receptor [Marinilabilia salmonicolor]